MNRKILFKAKRTDNGEWAEGYYCKTRIGNDAKPSDVIFVPFKVSRNEEWGWMKVDPDTICQYTGLTDKNGRKIWENDIVCVTHEKYQERDEMEVQPFFPEPKSYKRNYHVEFVNSGCCYGCRVRNKSIHFMLNRNVIFNHKVEAIGNVFDNPELLEV